MRMLSPAASLFVLVVWAHSGCDSSDDVGDDSNAHLDAGHDSGAQHDAGMPDSGSRPDAGTAPSADAATAGPERAITVRFRAQLGEAPYGCDASYPGLGATETEVTPRAFRFYVHDLRLITAEGDEVPVAVDVRAQWQLPEVSLLDFGDVGDCDPARTVNAVITGRVPAGDYRGVAFANGVPQALNHADPVTLTGPLQAPGMHWTWLSGFRFLIAEVAQRIGADADDDAGGPGGVGILHLGSVGCSGSPVAGGIDCQRPNRNQIRLDDFDAERDVIVADIGALFEDSDLSVPSVCHSADELCEPMIEALGIDWQTGTATTEQRVYRVGRRSEDAP